MLLEMIKVIFTVIGIIGALLLAYILKEIIIPVRRIERDAARNGYSFVVVKAHNYALFDKKTGIGIGYKSDDGNTIFFHHEFYNSYAGLKERVEKALGKMKQIISDATRIVSKMIDIPDEVKDELDKLDYIQDYSLDEWDPKIDDEMYLAPIKIEIGKIMYCVENMKKAQNYSNDDLSAILKYYLMISVLTGYKTSIALDKARKDFRIDYLYNKFNGGETNEA